MKFLPAVIATVLTALTVRAGTFNSPTPGQLLQANEPFTFNWTSGRYFKESSISVTVLLSSNWEANDYGAVLTENLAPQPQVYYPYVAQLTPSFVYSNGQTPSGEYDLVVIERYQAYGGVAAVAVNTEKVTF